MILTGQMESEINYVESCNDKQEVFRSGNAGRQRGDWQQGGKELAHMEQDGCIHGSSALFMASCFPLTSHCGCLSACQDILLNPRSFPGKKAMAVSVSGSPLMNICVICLSSAPLHWILQTRTGERSKEGKGRQPKAGASFLSWVERVCGAAGPLSQEQPLLGTGWGGQAEPAGLRRQDNQGIGDSWEKTTQSH